MRTYMFVFRSGEKAGIIVFPSLVNILCRTIAPFFHKRMRMVPNTCRNTAGRLNYCIVETGQTYGEMLLDTLPAEPRPERMQSNLLRRAVTRTVIANSMRVF